MTFVAPKVAANLSDSAGNGPFNPGSGSPGGGNTKPHYPGKFGRKTGSGPFNPGGGSPGGTQTPPFNPGPATGPVLQDSKPPATMPAGTYARTGTQTPPIYQPTPASTFGGMDFSNIPNILGGKGMGK